MDQLKDNFIPIKSSLYQYSKQNKQLLGSQIESYTNSSSFPILSAGTIALIGLDEYRGCQATKISGTNGCHTIRQHLYQLSSIINAPAIADLGNLKTGHTLQDSYTLMANTAAQLIEANVTPIFIGGSHDLCLANYLAYEQLDKLIHICQIDERFDIQKSAEEDNPNHYNYLSKIIMRPYNKLFNWVNMGYQRHFTALDEIQLMQQLYFETHSLSQIRANKPMAEAILRQSDMLSIDISAIRFCDAPANTLSSPNGFSGDEICELLRYAGHSTAISSIGIHNYNHTLDQQENTAQLIAQMLWYFLEGKSDTIDEHPAFSPPHNFRSYIISFNKQNRKDITFYKSIQSDRWWMEIPHPKNIDPKLIKHYYIACTYQEYQQALNNDVPERWIKSYQKLM